MAAQHGVRLAGVPLPQPHTAWFFLGTLALFLLVPDRRPQERPGWILLVLVALLALSRPLEILRTRLVDREPLSGSVFRSTDRGPRFGGVVNLERLRIAGPRQLLRLTGRRDEVGIGFELFFRAPSTGDYRFDLACDDRCELAIDGQDVSPEAGSGIVQLALEEGVHSFPLVYHQTTGRARLAVEGHLPGLVRLPLEWYLANHPEELRGGAFLRSRLRVLLSFVLLWLWWVSLFAVVVRIGESRRDRRKELQAAISTVLRRAVTLRERMRRYARSFLLVAMAVMVATAVTAPFLLLPSAVRITATRGEWKEVTEGFQLSGEPPALGAGTRAVVHFHDLDGSAATLRMGVSAIPEAAPVTISAWVNRERQDTFEISTEPQEIEIAVPSGTRALDVRLEAEPARPTQGALYLLHQTTLSRELTTTRILRWLLPLFAALAAAWLLPADRGSWRWGLGILLASALTASALAVVSDPSSSLGFSALARDVFRLAALALLWLYALTGRAGWRDSIAAIVGSVGILYLPTLHYGFITDDFLFGRPLRFQELTSTLYGQWDPRGLANAHYRPVIAWSLAADYTLWGDATHGYHLTNLLAYAAASLVALVLLRKVLPLPLAALGGALVWCAHPMGAASAAWANERTDGIMTLFYLATLALLVSPRFTRARAAAAVALALLALGSKEMALTLPLTGLLMIRFFRRDDARLRYATVGVLGFAVLLYVFGWIQLFPDKALATARVAAERPADTGFLGHPLAQVYPAVFVPGTYRWWQQVQFDGMPWGHFLAGVLAWPLLWLAGGRSGRTARDRRAILLGGLWPLLTLIPLLGLRGGVDLYRLGFLIAGGLAWTWAGLGSSLAIRSRPVMVAATTILSVWLGYASIRSAEAWGPEGFMTVLGTRWKLHDQAWQQALSPEMRRLFWNQIERAEHARRWVTREQAKP